MATNATTNLDERVPACAHTCVDAIMFDWNCPTTNTLCFCSAHQVITADTLQSLHSFIDCSQTYCTRDENDAVINDIDAACQEVGLPIDDIMASASVAYYSTTAGATAVSATIGASATASEVRGSITTVNSEEHSPTPNASGTSSSTFTTQNTETSPPGQITIVATSYPGSPSSLSPGVAAGIAVGATLVLVLVALGAFFFWKHRKATEMTVPGLPSQDEKAVPHQTPSELWSGNGNSHEIGGKHVGPERKELEDEHGLKIARDREERVELPGS